MLAFVRILTTVLLSVTALVGGGATHAVAQQDQQVASACAGVSDCHVVARPDVNGDGHPDQVGWRQLGTDLVQVRVRMASGALLTHRIDVHLWWGGGAWGGATAVDSRPGAELLIGSAQGAHTPMYTMLTFRAGALVVERSPSPLSPRWQVDAAYGDYMGWWRHVAADGKVTVTQKIAVRNESGQGFSGHNATYAWSAARGWTRTSTVHVSYPTVKSAAVIGGFHVGSLARFPGLG
jgi:hypothetical protein